MSNGNSTSSSNVSIKEKIKADTIVKIYHIDDTDQKDDTKKEELMENPRFLLAYWSIRGLAAPTRMMLSAAKVNHWILMYDVTEDGESSWLKEAYMTDKAFLKDNYNVLMNLPYLVDCNIGDNNNDNKHQNHEFVLAQTNAIMTHLGRELSMLGTTKEETCRCEELLCEIMDLRNKMVRFAYQGSVETAKEDALHLMQSLCAGNFEKLELYLSKKYKKDDDTINFHKVTYLVGSSMTAPDFHLWEMLDQFDTLCQYYELNNDNNNDNDNEDATNVVWSKTKYPFLLAFKENFASLPENAAYFQSSVISDLPFNNPYARFGSDLKTKGKYQRGQETPWMGKGIVEEPRTIGSNKKQKVED